MSAESNKAISMRHYREVLTGKRLDVIDQIYASQIKVGDGPTMPREQFKMMASMTVTAFPDLVVTVHDQITERDLVVSRWTATGTHLGDFIGQPAAGRKVTIKAIHIHQIVDGRIATLWEEIDLLALSKQLGIAL
jgi:C-1 hydroxylase